MKIQAFLLERISLTNLFGPHGAGLEGEAIRQQQQEGHDKERRRTAAEAAIFIWARVRK